MLTTNITSSQVATMTTANRPKHPMRQRPSNPKITPRPWIKKMILTAKKSVTETVRSTCDSGTAANEAPIPRTERASTPTAQSGASKRLILRNPKALPRRRHLAPRGRTLDRAKERPESGDERIESGREHVHHRPDDRNQGLDRDERKLSLDAATNRSAGNLHKHRRRHLGKVHASVEGGEAINCHAQRDSRGDHKRYLGNARTPLPHERGDGCRDANDGTANSTLETPSSTIHATRTAPEMPKPATKPFAPKRSDWVLRPIARHATPSMGYRAITATDSPIPTNHSHPPFGREARCRAERSRSHLIRLRYAARRTSS